MLMKLKVLIPCLLIAATMGVLLSQEAPAPLTDNEKLQAAEAFILLQNSQQQMLASPTWQAFQQRQREYHILLQGFQQSKSAAANCTLTIKQEWFCPSSLIIQSTQGPNSPNVVGNKGDEEKESDGKPEVVENPEPEK